jgi:hypothetical protein
MRKGRIHTNAEVQRIISDIRTLMQQGKDDNEIREILGIEIRQYQRFTAAINKQNQKAWYSLVKNELATELIKMKASLEDSYQAALLLSKRSGLTTTDVLAALAAKDSARISVIQLLKEGTELLMKQQQQQQPKYHKIIGQNTIMMQPHP